MVKGKGKGRDKSKFKACRPCRSKRTRCDGQQPCQLCRQRETECVYDQRPGETKSKLRDERAQLQGHQRATDIVLGALVSGSGEDTEVALASLWRREPIDKIANDLNRMSQESAAASRPTSAAPAVSDSGRHDSDVYDEDEEDEGEEADGNENDTGSEENYHWAGPAKFGNPSIDDHPSSRALASGSTELVDWAPFVPDSTGFEVESSAHAASKQASLGADKALPRLFTAETSPTPSSSSVPFGLHVSATGETSGTGSASGAWHSTDLMVLPYDLVQTCFNVFFERQYVPFHSIQRVPFMKDFHDGDQRHCSSALVRSIACLACRVLGGYDAAAGQSYHARLGDRLYDEANRLLALTAQVGHSTPDAQALGLLSLHQLGMGDFASARRLADESVRRIDIVCRRKGEEEPRDSKYTTTALFGAISLARMIRLITGYLAKPSPFAGIQPFGTDIKGNVPSTSNAHVEQLLTFLGPIQPSMSSKGVFHLSSIMLQLTGWVYSYTSRSHIRDGDALPGHLLDTYRACLSWYEFLMRQIDEQGDVGPFIHLYYHFCLLALFRPYYHVRSSDPDVLPSEICSESGEAMLALAASCYQLGTQHLPCFVPLLVHAAGLLEEAAGDDLEHDQRRGSMEFEQSESARGGGGTQAGDDLGFLPEAGNLPLSSIGSLAERAMEQLTMMGKTYPCARSSRADLQRVLDKRSKGKAVARLGGV